MRCFEQERGPARSACFSCATEKSACHGRNSALCRAMSSFPVIPNRHPLAPSALPDFTVTHGCLRLPTATALFLAFYTCPRVGFPPTRVHGIAKPQPCASVDSVAKKSPSKHVARRWSPPVTLDFWCPPFAPHLRLNLCIGLPGHVDIALQHRRRLPPGPSTPPRSSCPSWFWPVDTAGQRLRDRRPGGFVVVAVAKEAGHLVFQEPTRSVVDGPEEDGGDGDGGSRTRGLGLPLARWVRNSLPALPAWGATSVSQMAVSAASTWQKKGRIELNRWWHQCSRRRAVSRVTFQSLGLGRFRLPALCHRWSGTAMVAGWPPQ